MTTEQVTSNCGVSFLQERFVGLEKDRRRRTRGFGSLRYRFAFGNYGVVLRAQDGNT